MEWVADYGFILNNIAHKELVKIQEQMGQFRRNLDEVPESLDKLKFLLHVLRISKLKTIVYSMFH